MSELEFDVPMVFYFDTEIGRFSASATREAEARDKVNYSLQRRSPGPKYGNGQRVYVVNGAGEIVVRDTVIASTYWSDDQNSPFDTDLATGKTARRLYRETWMYIVRDPHALYPGHGPVSYTEACIRPFVPGMERVVAERRELETEH